ncbi:Mu-like prophage major head subunit gpT family protein [Burkholderia vietnamiensis]|uniref:Mu-like prophage major head subunit gpT family protein n=1 Tax=Burkholderia vietnamiensis TaxID=60552 RepID=UPI001593B8F5|nr:Mu-like prophage major head subunit gpT family protein [Burkholderia vietnamiensis]MCA8016163.1 Mu-like prophage major head subunit gpT family protein [Burkholderia vietnamiensis]MDN8035360.1 Mu-like prophage major head subunit gpT family protein [Burkholderia vietnamiensis]
MEINRANLRALFTGYNTVFQQAFDGAASDWNKVAMPVPSTTSQEVYPWLGQTTRFREWIGDRVIQNLTTHDFTIKNKPFENTVGVDRDAISDDTYGVYKPVIAQMGLDAKQHPDELVFNLLKQGTTKTCYDGQYFFDTDHPVLQENGQIGSVSNFQAGTGPTWYLLDMTRVVKPIILQQRKPYTFVPMDQETDEIVFTAKTFRYGVDARCNVGFALWQLAYASNAELNEDSYQAARKAMTGMKGDNGRPLGIRPSLLVVPPMYEGVGRKILHADSNNYGATNIWKGSADLLATPWLA